MMKEITLKYNLQEAKHGRCYPCTIIMDRYTGAYSGGLWVAFNLDAHDVPFEVDDSDPICSNYWDAHEQLVTPVGKGNTPQEAYDDLLKNIIIYCEHHLNF